MAWTETSERPSWSVVAVETGYPSSRSIEAPSTGLPVRASRIKNLIGIVALQIACVGWAIGSALSRRHARNEDVFPAAAVQMIFGGLFMIVAGPVRGEWSQLAFSTRSALAEIYLTVIGSIVGYSAYTHALRHLPTATVSLYAYANPIIAIALGTLLANEPFGARVVIASLMVLTGSALVQWRAQKERRWPPMDGAPPVKVMPAVTHQTRAGGQALSLRRPDARSPTAPGTARWR